MKKEKRLGNVTLEHIDRIIDELDMEFDDFIDSLALPIDLTDYFINNHVLDNRQSNLITKHIIDVKRKLYRMRGIYPIKFGSLEEVSSYFSEMVTKYGMNDFARLVNLSVKDVMDVSKGMESMVEIRVDRVLRALCVFNEVEVSATGTSELAEVVSYLREIRENEFSDMNETDYKTRLSRVMSISFADVSSLLDKGVATRMTLKRVATFIESLNSGGMDMFKNALIIETD